MREKIGPVQNRTDQGLGERRNDHQATDVTKWTQPELQANPDTSLTTETHPSNDLLLEVSGFFTLIPWLPRPALAARPLRNILKQKSMPQPQILEPKFTGPLIFVAEIWIAQF